MLACFFIAIGKGEQKSMQSEVKLIFTAKLARYLLKQGYQIIDIKPNKDNPERTVFIFMDCAGLKEIIREFKQNTKITQKGAAKLYG